jgi:3-hydroxybutyrate dehydrogenase
MAALEGKTALVTGSTSGIGRGIAEHLAAQGCNMVLNGFGEAAEIEAQRARLAEAAGVEVIYSDADMSLPDRIAAMIAGAQARFGALDILVNNAGIQHVAAIEDFPPEAWDRIIAINSIRSARHCRA